jgi:hypothetical protein
MATEKQDQSKVVDTDDELPRTRQQRRLIENNNHNNQKTLGPWPPTLAQSIPPDISEAFKYRTGIEKFRYTTT